MKDFLTNEIIQDNDGIRWMVIDDANGYFLYEVTNRKEKRIIQKFDERDYKRISKRYY